MLNLYVPKLAPQPRTPPLSRTPQAVINRWNLALDRVVEEVPAPVERAGAVTSIRSPLCGAVTSIQLAIPYASLAAACLLTLYRAMPALRALGATYSATAIAAPIACSTLCAATLYPSPHGNLRRVAPQQGPPTAPARSRPRATTADPSDFVNPDLPRFIF